MSTTELQNAPVQNQEVSAFTMTPRADGWESKEAYVLTVEMPGVDEAHLDITIERNVLTVSGTHEFPQFEGLTAAAGNGPARRYERSFRLPDGIDASRLDASIRAGVLTLHMPKAPEAQLRKISVRSA